VTLATSQPRARGDDVSIDELRARNAEAIRRADQAIDDLRESREQADVLVARVRDGIDDKVLRDAAEGKG
jgi:hypothetical protein